MRICLQCSCCGPVYLFTYLFMLFINFIIKMPTLALQHFLWGCYTWSNTNILKHCVSITKKKVFGVNPSLHDLAAKTADYSRTLNGNSYKSCCTQVVPERTRKHFIEVGKNSVGQGILPFSSFYKRTLGVWRCAGNIRPFSCCCPFVWMYRVCRRHWCVSFSASL